MPSEPITPLPAADTPRGAAIEWTLFVLWLATVFVLSSIPAQRFGAPPFSFADKAVHCVLFAPAAFLLARALKRSLGWSWPVVVGATFLVMSGVALLDEFHQSFTPGRSGNDTGDMMADALGAVIGISLARLFHGRPRPHPDRRAPRADRAS